MRLKQHIKEGYYPPGTERSVNVPIDDAIKLIKQHCKSALSAYKSGKVVYRGVGMGDTNFMFIQPSKFTRASANTTNLYTTLIDGSSKWKEYPKRSKSIICTTSFDSAQNYGRLYIVLPVDGYKFGVCPRFDMWASFDDSINDSLDTFNDSVEYIKNRLGVDFNMRSGLKTYSDLVKLCKMMDKAFKEYDDEVDYEWMKWYKGDFLKLFDQLLDPAKNHFKISKDINNLPRSRNEVWTDSDCYMVALGWTQVGYNIESLIE